MSRRNASVGHFFGYVAIFTVANLLCACGGGSSVIPAEAGIQNDPSVSSASPSPQPSPTRGGGATLDPRARFWEPMIRSADFTGQIAVMFKESAGVRFGAGANTFRSKFNADLTPLNALMAQHPEATVRLGLPDIDQDFLDQRVQEIRAVEGYPMTDWASFYIIDVMDADEAMEILNGLVTLSQPVILSFAANLKTDPSPPKADPPLAEASPQNDTGLVLFAHPIPKAYPTGIQIPNITPGPGQDYLKDLASTGGLNVKAAWDAGLDGTGIVLRDEEAGWNVSHLDLPLSETSYIVKPTTTVPDYNIQHGAAVAGVLVGKNNGIGITGMVPNATMQLTSLGAGGTLGDLLTYLIKNQSTYADGGSATHNVKPGDVLLIEFQLPITGSNPSCGPTSANNPTTKCGPNEAYYSSFSFLKDLVNYGGLVVVEAAANGGLNLDGIKYFDGDGIVDFSKDSSGAIMVGASMGGSTLLNGKHTLEKAPYSNCGSRVDVFAWGAGVVTTGYGDHPISVTKSAGDADAMKVDPALLNGATKYVDPNQAYTASFAGTSSATAIIAGGAALLQQYAKQLYSDPKGACAIKTWEYVYLSSQQMRDVMVQSGTTAKPYISDSQMWNNYKDPNPGCSIGIQPDLGKAMQIIKDGCDGKASGVKATVKTKDLTSYCPKATLANPNPKKQPWCPDYGPLQPPIAKMMDLDGDGRADLISFSKDRKWFVDLSTVGPTQFAGLKPNQPKDNFGMWNLTFDLSKDASIAKDAMLFPVVMDYNTDGKADLALYDSVHGKWYVHFTTGNTLNTSNAVNGVNPWPGWDMVIDYSTQPHWQPYSRPVPGEYDGQDNDPYTLDHYMDIGLQTPDGWLLEDLGGSNPKANYGAFDQMIPIISNGVLAYSTYDLAQFKYVNKQVADTPAWAWLPIVYLGSYNYDSTYAAGFGLKAPDNIGPDISNKLVSWDGSTLSVFYKSKDYGANDVFISEARFQTKSFADLGLKRQCDQVGFWSVATDQSGWDDIIYIDPYIDFGDINCRPIPGDYDGDGYDDRAVQCGNVWKIAYTGSKYPINSNANSQVTDCTTGKTITASQAFRVLTEPQLQTPLPGFVYPGGVTFKETKEIFAAVNNLCPSVAPTGNNPPCTLLNMTPAPIGPYFPQCVDAVKKQYASDPCLDPNQKVACETLRIQQAQCVYQ